MSHKHHKSKHRKHRHNDGHNKHKHHEHHEHHEHNEHRRHEGQSHKHHKHTQKHSHTEQNQEYQKYSELHRKHNEQDSDGKTEFLKPYKECEGKEKLKYILTRDIFTGAPRKKSVDQVTLTFLGAAGTVTGSKYLVEYGKTKVLVDCGLFQGLKELRLRNWECLPFHPKNIDAVILTHAHLDHSGYVPILIKNGFKGKIYCTKATYELCKILLPDSGYLQEEAAKYAKLRGFSKHKNPKPLYNQKEAVNALKYFHPVDFKTETKISNDISFMHYGMGHILGASSVKVKVDGKSIVFSGDIGRPNSPIMKDPEGIAEADYVLVESTYGDRRHKESTPEDELEKVINETVRRGGSIIIPAFAVGRSQKVLYHVHQLKKKGRIPNIPVFLDSPMSIKVTNLLDDFSDEHKLNKQECFDIYEGTRFTVTAKQSKEIANFNVPAIIISASGMATGGRILHHIAHFGQNHKNTILFTGYQAMETRGRTIVDGKKEVKMHGKIIPIRADVRILHNMSAHGDYKEVLDWLRQFKTPPKKIFVIHGEPNASLAFEKRIKKELNWETCIPKYLQMEKLL